MAFNLQSNDWSILYVYTYNIYLYVRARVRTQRIGIEECGSFRSQCLYFQNAGRKCTRIHFVSTSTYEAVGLSLYLEVSIVLD